MITAVLIILVLAAVVVLVAWRLGCPFWGCTKAQAKYHPLTIVRNLLYLLGLILFVVLTVSGFYPPLFLGEELSGYLLMIHVTAGGGFAGCLTLLMLMWAHRCRFSDDVLNRMLCWLAKRPQIGDSPPAGGLWPKLLFWMITVLSLPLILSAVLSMFPIFGTTGQYVLAGIHRGIAYAFAVVIIAHTFAMALGRKQ